MAFLLGEVTVLKSVRVAVVGATGEVGRAMIATLIRREFPFSELKLLASKRSAGSYMSVQGTPYVVEEATAEAFEDIDLALFSAGGSVSVALAPEAVKRGALVIDNTSAFRLTDGVPLVVPEVNADALWTHQGIIANPNCSTIQMVVALNPIYRRYGLRRIIVSTYQAASGAGKVAVAELKENAAQRLAHLPMEARTLPVAALDRHYPLAFNVLPQIDVFEDNGFTREEMKMVRETQKIFNDQTIKVTATAARVPVVYGHSEAVYAETVEPYDMAVIRRLLRDAPGVVVQDDPATQTYPQPLLAEGELDVFVGRLRQDLFEENAFSMWVVADNILKGAAWNAVQIAELWLRGEASRS